MSIHISESDIDHHEIVYKLHPANVEAALGNVQVALAELAPLRSDDPQVRSNEVYRALTLARDALADCLSDPPDPFEED